MIGIFVNEVIIDLLVCLMWVQLIYYGSETFHNIILGYIYTMGTLNIGLGNNLGLFLFSEVSLATS